MNRLVMLLLPFMFLLLFLPLVSPAIAIERDSFYMRNIEFGSSVCTTSDLRFFNTANTATTQFTITTGQQYCWFSDVLGEDDVIPLGDWILFVWMSDSLSADSSTMLLNLSLVDADGSSNPTVLIDTSQVVSATASTEFTFVAANVPEQTDNRRWRIAFTRDVGSTNDPRLTIGGAEAATGDSQLSIPALITVVPPTGNIFDTLLPIGLVIAVIFFVVGHFIKKPFGTALISLSGISLLFVAYDYSLATADMEISLILAIGGVLLVLYAWFDAM